MIGVRWAGLLATGIVVIAPAVHAQDAMGFAEQRYRRGVELFVAGNYTPALSEFQNSLQLYDSPNARLFVARCLERLNRPVQALAEFERTARDAEERARTDTRYVATRDAAREELRGAEQRVGRLTIIVRDPPSGLSVTVEGAPVLPAALGLPLPVAPGPVRVSVSAPAYASIEREVYVEAGHSEQTTMTLLPSEAPHVVSVVAAPVRPVIVTHAEAGRSNALVGVGWTGVTLGVVGLAAFGVTYGLALGEYHQLEQTCGAAGCTMSPDAGIARGSALEIAAYGSLAFGLVNATVGIVSLVATRHRSESPRVVFGPNSIGVTGAF